MTTRKWCVYNRISHILIGLLNIGSYVPLNITTTAAQQLLSCVPVVGFAASVMDFYYMREQYKEVDYLKGYNFGNDRTELQQTYENYIPKWGLPGRVGFFARGMSSTFLMGTSIQGMYSTFLLGVPGLGLIPLAYAIKSGVDFLGACAAYHKVSTSYTDDKIAAVMDLFSKGILFAGWVLVACGHPVGWVLLVAAILPSILQCTAMDCSLKEPASPMSLITTF